MGYVPLDAKWFIADLVEAIIVAGHPEVIVHINKTLIRANTAESAYIRALEKGRAGTMRYENVAGEEVAIRFLGIQELNVIHDVLEDGAELSYEERSLATEEAAKALVRKKKDLAVFRPVRRSKGPDYVERSITESLIEHGGDKKNSTTRKRKKS